MPLAAVIALIAELFKDVIIPLEPAVEQAIKDWQNGKLTAQQADEAAGGAFTLMMGRLQNPHAEAAIENGSIDAILASKFPKQD